MKRHISYFLAALLLLALNAIGCSDKGSGTVEVEIYGEDFIEQGIASSEFADGWAIHFDHFCVNIGDVQAADQSFPVYRIFDLTNPGPTEIASGPADEGAIAPGAYRIRPADSQSINIDAPADIASLMQENGYSVYIQATATKDASTIILEWGFETDTEYGNCHATDKVPDGGVGIMQVTIHGDHLFMDSLVEMEPSLRFDPIAAADADADGRVTLEELAQVSGTAFEALDHYDVDPDSQIDDLRAYVTYLATTIGHIDGEGHCE